MAPLTPGNDTGTDIAPDKGPTVPELVKALSGSDAVPPIGEEEYDTMYVVTVPSVGPASVLRMNY